MTTLRELSFSADEYRRRIESVQAVMAEKDLPVLVLCNMADICYLSGFQTIGSYGYGLYALVLPLGGEPILFASDFESHNASIGSLCEDIVVYDVRDQMVGSPVAQLAGLLQERNLASGRIGCEGGHYGLTAVQMARLQSRLIGVTWVEAADVVECVKIVKSEEEIAVIRKAASLTTAGTLAGIEVAAEGRGDNDIAASIYERIVSAGGEYFSLQPVVTTGNRSGIPHTTFRRAQLTQGDNVFIEVSAACERYSAPTLRTLCIGVPSDEVRRAFDACKASVETIKAHLRDGASARVAAQRAGQALRAIEPNLVWHGCYGYSVGLTFPPMCTDCTTMGDITETTDYELRADMVFHINTSLRKLGEFGVTMGDTVLVTEAACETLTRVPRELFVSG